MQPTSVLKVFSIILENVNFRDLQKLPNILCHTVFKKWDNKTQHNLQFLLHFLIEGIFQVHQQQFLVQILQLLTTHPQVGDVLVRLCQWKNAPLVSLIICKKMNIYFAVSHLRLIFRTFNSWYSRLTYLLIQSNLANLANCSRMLNIFYIISF